MDLGLHRPSLNSLDKNSQKEGRAGGDETAKLPNSKPGPTRFFHAGAPEGEMPSIACGGSCRRDRAMFNIFFEIPTC